MPEASSRIWILKRIIAGYSDYSLDILSLLISKFLLTWHRFAGVKLHGYYCKNWNAMDDMVKKPPVIEKETSYNRMLASTTSVDEYFDELVEQVRQDYSNP